MKIKTSKGIPNPPSARDKAIQVDIFSSPKRVIEMIIRLSKNLFINTKYINLIIKTQTGLKIIFPEPLIEESTEDGEGGYFIKQVGSVELSGKQAKLFMERLKPLGWDEDSLYEEFEDELEEEESEEIDLSDVKTYEG